MPQSPDPILAERSFAAALMADDVPLPPGIVTRAGVLPRDRFGIHRNNAAAGLGAVLRARFPVLERLVGDAFFAFMGHEFVRAHPPVSPVLMEYGARMPDFLRCFSPVAHLHYLPDVAQLEWQRHVAQHAADATPLDPAMLASVAPAQMERLRFDLHPSLAILMSPYPVVSIWRANTGGDPHAVIPAGLPAEAALILRPHLETAVHAVASGDALFYRRLLAGDPLGIAADAAGPELDLTAALTLLFRAGAITGFRLASPRPTRS